jgi:hypothetical protein
MDFNIEEDPPLIGGSFMPGFSSIPGDVFGLKVAVGS